MPIDSSTHKPKTESDEVMIQLCLGMTLFIRYDNPINLTAEALSVLRFISNYFTCRLEIVAPLEDMSFSVQPP